MYLDPLIGRHHTMQKACTAVLVILACAGLAGCGSSASSPDVDPAAHVSTFILPEASSGPFDINHRDDAIAAATRFAQRSPGHPSLSDPQAIFQPMYAVPQVSSQEVVPPTYGWSITFMAHYHGVNEPGSGTAPVTPEDQPHIEGTSIPVPPVVAFTNPKPAAPGTAKQAPTYVSPAPLSAEPQETTKDGVLLVPENGPGARPALYAQPRLPGPDLGVPMTDASASPSHPLPRDVRTPVLSHPFKQITVFISVDGSLHLM